jgi:hypothetical protein
LMRHYCTYFDSRFLVRGLTMWRSLSANETEARLHVLCLDEAAHDALQGLALPDVEPLRLDDIEAADPSLGRCRGTRSPVEYYFTCTAVLVRHVLERVPEGGLVVYVDADLHFFSPVQPLYDEMGDASILIIPHRFPERLRGEERHGLYNVGLVAFRKDPNGIACAAWWRERCLEWCYDRCEDGKFADQKYLDEWRVRFPGVHVLEHPGADVAPWNIERYRVGRRGRTVTVDGAPLVFYHFQGYRELTDWFVDPGLGCYGRLVDSSVARVVHGRYVKELMATRRWLRRQGFRRVGDRGNTRSAEAASFAAFSVPYRWRRFLEGRAMVKAFGTAWYAGRLLAS